MNKIFPGIGIGMAVIVIIYFVGFEIENNQKFLEIIDHEIIQKKCTSLFLSAIVLEKIPEKLYRYITNIHSNSK